MLLTVLDRDLEDNTAKMRRAVRANNFTQQTNALDVAKHMYLFSRFEKQSTQPYFRPGWHTSKRT